MLIKAFITGFLLGLSLILPIGAQNSFVLKCALKKHHIFFVCLFCAVSDALLIILGVFSVNIFMDYVLDYIDIIYIIAAMWLSLYGILHIKSAWQGNSINDDDGKQHILPSLWKSLSLCAIFTWLNPHVYLDTTILIGTVSSQFILPDRYIFMMGAILASFVFFYSLGYGARILSPFMHSKLSWKILDIFIALVMFFIAYSFIKKYW